MGAETYLIYLLSDTRCLRSYFKEHHNVGLEDIKRGILLNARQRDYALPDHYYRLGVEAAFKGINNIAQLFTKGLPELSSKYLEFYHNRLYVRGNMFNDWQLLVTHIPPLLLAICKIWKEYGSAGSDLIEYLNKRVLPSIRNTAILPPYLPEMELLRTENGGFDDFHFHLNGATEVDLMWHMMLRFPDDTYAKLLHAYRNDTVKEQIQQMTDLSKPEELYDLLRIAGHLRRYLYTLASGNAFDSKFESMDSLLSSIANDHNFDTRHPMESIIGSNAFPLLYESALYLAVLDKLAENENNNTLATLFHYYLLIMGLCNQLLVQQTDAFGFEQFQKYTSNNLRDFAERTYNARFIQLAGNDLNNIGHLEGRFSPKNSIEDNLNLINKINSGFEALKRKQKEINVPESSLSLIAHYIKRKDDKKHPVRHFSVRKDLEHRTDALIALMHTATDASKLLCGFDAAASEFDAPPEVFANSFRRLREAGAQRFTFHAGEDFYHLLSGLRAIWEAIEFLDLRAGDRIGHATAAGIDVETWSLNVGDCLWVRKGDYLDDLTFAYHLIAESDNCKPELKQLLPILALRIENYASEIYGDDIGSLRNILQAWLLRKEDPLVESQAVESKSRHLYRLYHTDEVRKRYEETIEVPTFDIFDAEELTSLQHMLLYEMFQRQILIETLPTSNILIGRHRNFKSHQLRNWFKWSKAGIKVPAILVGCDDAGIFATNIYNEYCHIYCLLVFDMGVSIREALAYIRQLISTARLQRPHTISITTADLKF